MGRGEMFHFLSLVSKGKAWRASFVFFFFFFPEWEKDTICLHYILSGDRELSFHQEKIKSASWPWVSCSPLSPASPPSPPNAVTALQEELLLSMGQIPQIFPQPYSPSGCLYISRYSEFRLHPSGGNAKSTQLCQLPRLPGPGLGKRQKISYWENKTNKWGKK